MKQRTILVVDHSMAVRKALRLLLRSRGFEAQAAETPTEAVRASRREVPAALVVGRSPLGGGALSPSVQLRNEPSLVGIPLIEVPRVDEIVREIDGGWEYCGTAARDLLARVQHFAGNRPLGPNPFEVEHQPEA
ncbi:MAG: response regulator [bacterium]|nr:response regulator [bacterium]